MNVSEKKSPVVSVIVPVYNVENYIRRCIDSILAQTFGDFELILVDDGSTDESGHICDGYACADNRLVVLHQKNQGVSVARNAGLDISKGKYIGFVDSDDYINPDFLELMVNALESSKAEIVMCDIAVIENGVYRQDIHCKFPDSASLLERDEILRNIVQYKSNGYSSLWNKLYCKNIIEQNRLRIPLNISFGEDLIFNISYIKYISFARHIKSVLYNYITSDSGLYKKYRADYLSDCMHVRQILLDELKEYENYDKGFIRLNKKFLSDIERYIMMVYENEDHPTKLVKQCYRDSDVRDCMNQLYGQYVMGNKSALTDLAQVRIAKWISTGKIALAVWYTDYLHNPRNILKKWRSQFSLFQTIRKDRNLKRVKSFIISNMMRGGGVGLGKKTKAIIEGDLVVDNSFYFNRCHDGINNQPGTLYVATEGRLEVSGAFSVYSGGYVTVASGACLKIGSGFINNNGKISCFNKIEIGDDVKISEDVTIRDSDNHRMIREGYEVSQPIKIGNHVWIGLGVTILKGVTIGDGAVIAAGSVVTKDVPARSLAVGVPAKVVKQNIEWK